MRVLHASHNLAKLPFDLSVRVSRERLRPGYGEGFLGAPVVICLQSGDKRPASGGADAPAQRTTTGPGSQGQP